MPPEATDMITSAPPPSQAVKAHYYPASKHSVERDGRGGDDYAHKMNNLGPRKPSERMSNPNEGNLSDAYAMPHSMNGHSHNTNSTPADNGHGNGGYMSSVYNGGDQVESTRQEEEYEEKGESQDYSEDPLKEPLHKTLYDNFHSELDILRDVVIEALQLSCQEQERLCIEGEELEARIACMRKKIELARDELLAKGALTEDMDENLRLSLVKEGGEDIGSTGLGTLTEGESTEEVPHATPSVNRINHAGLRGSVTSKRFSMRSSPLNSSYSTQFSKGSAMSEAAGMPHMSRNSLLGMLGASKTWLDNYANSASEVDNGSRDSSANCARISFMEGAGDGMPSRWRAREQEREKTAKQQEDEERRLQQKVIDVKKNGADSKPVPLPKREQSKTEKLKDLIAKSEGEISVLENRTSCVERETSTMRDEITMLEIDQRQEQSEFERERRKLLEELDQVEFDNERLDHMLVETGVSLEEKKIIIEILADELKGAREKLAHIQNERDRQQTERRRKDRSRRWGGWMRNSASSLLGLDDGNEEETPDQRESRPRQKQKSKSTEGQGQDNVSRYQVPPDVLQQYRTLVSSSDDDTSADNGDNLDPDQSGSGDSEPRLDRRRSYASVGTQMSSLTLDSCELVDILEQLEL